MDKPVKMKRVRIVDTPSRKKDLSYIISENVKILSGKDNDQNLSLTLKHWRDWKQLQELIESQKFFTKTMMKGKNCCGQCGIDLKNFDNELCSACSWLQHHVLQQQLLMSKVKN